MAVSQGDSYGHMQFSVASLNERPDLASAAFSLKADVLPERSVTVTPEAYLLVGGL